MLLLISFIVFGGLQLMDVDPISYMLTPDMAASVENQEALREQLGLNDPFVVRYFNWIKDLLAGNFGYSIVNGSSIASGGKGWYHGDGHEKAGAHAPT